jgi:hypothetical protein
MAEFVKDDELSYPSYIYTFLGQYIWIIAANEPNSVSLFYILKSKTEFD